MLHFIAELNVLAGKSAAERIDGALETVGLLDEASKKIAFYFQSFSEVQRHRHWLHWRC
jgi:hypothetical protein